jgi:hypothetical protein
MTNTKKIVHGVGVVILLIVAFAWGKSHGSLQGSISPAGNPSSNFTYVEVSDALQADSLFGIGGAIGTNSSITKAVSTGACNGTFGGTSFAASSTLAVIKNPLTATSSVSIKVFGIGQATTSSLQVGTTTAPSGLASTISSNLVNTTNGLATTTQFYIGSGMTAGLGTGQVSAGSGTIGNIIVGPAESIGLFSTSTATGAGAANYIPGQTCNFKIDWTE